ncbi:MAG: transglycosylase domain-containing protein [Thermomicrobiales bacterium]
MRGTIAMVTCSHLVLTAPRSIKDVDDSPVSQGNFSRAFIPGRPTAPLNQRIRANRRMKNGRKLPPHLLPGTSRQRTRGGNRNRNGFLIVGGIIFLGLFVTTLLSLVVSTIAGTAATVEAYRQVNEDLPNAAEVTTDTFQTSRIYDRNGVLLQEIEAPDGGWRTFVTLDQISPYLIDATVAAEDATFWSHYGVEPMAIVRGALINASGSGSSGGSTITQQLARGLYPDQIGFDISITRKVKEAFAAVELERQFSKQDILTMYLNQIFYGQRSYGIEAAAQTFFQKHASELTLAEASLLAGLPQAPSFYDPTIRFDQAKIRQQYVLDQMVKFDYITQEEADAAWAEPLTPVTRTSEIRAAPHFTEYAKDYLRELYGDDILVTGGIEVWTTIDVELQAEAEAIVKENMPFLNAYRRNNAAMVVMVPYTGEVLAMVGSADFNDASIGGQINYARANLQTGSSIKPVVYAAAFENGWNPGTVVMDITLREPTPGAPQPYYEPNNYSGRFYGAVTVRKALANSLNIPAVKAGRFAGIDQVYDLYRRMGIKTGMPEGWENYGLSLSLGSAEVPLLEHTNVYATFANNGKYVPATPILKITDSNGNILYELKRDQTLANADQALQAEYAYQITSILTDNEARSMMFGRGNLFENTADQLGRPVAAKSGTTDSWKDIWTMGYTTDLAIGVWTGQTSQTGSAEISLPVLDGIEGAGPIWQAMMELMHDDPRWASYLNGPDGQPLPLQFQRPPGLTESQVCNATGHQASNSGNNHTELLVEGEGPALSCGQLSALERKELELAMEDIRKNAGKYSGDAIDSIYRYASAVGVYSGDLDWDDDDGESVTIQPVDGNSVVEEDIDSGGDENTQEIPIQSRD